MTLYDKHDINNPIKGKLDDNADFYDELKKVKNEADLKSLLDKHIPYFTSKGRYTLHIYV